MVSLIQFCKCQRSGSPAFAFAIVVAVMLVAGCEQIKDAADDVTETVGEQVESVSDTVSETVTEQTESVMETAAAVVPAAAPVETHDPQKLLDELRSLKSNEISDTLLSQLAATPEAATQITELSLDAATISVAGVASIQAFTNLESLGMKGVRIEPADFAPLAQVTSLQSLDLSMTKADNSIIETLTSLESLESLKLDSAPVTSGIRQPLTRLPIKDLSAQLTQFGDQDVAAISGLSIRSLNLSQSQITSAAIADIAKIETLEELNVSKTTIQGSAFVALRGSRLKSLDASGTVFAVVGLQAIKGMKSLETLILAESTIIEDPNANVFKTFSSLKLLDLSRNKISDQGVQLLLKGNRTIEHLSLRGIPTISDFTLGHLVNNKSLKYLDVDGGSACSAAGVKLFHEKRPDCVIQSTHGRFGPPDEAATAT